MKKEQRYLIEQLKYQFVNTQSQTKMLMKECGMDEKGEEFMRLSFDSMAVTISKLLDEANPTIAQRISHKLKYMIISIFKL